MACEYAICTRNSVIVHASTKSLHNEDTIRLYDKGTIWAFLPLLVVLAIIYGKLLSQLGNCTGVFLPEDVPLLEVTEQARQV